jgi:hypothetical protein
MLSLDGVIVSVYRMPTGPDDMTYWNRSTFIFCGSWPLFC